MNREMEDININSQPKYYFDPAARFKLLCSSEDHIS